MRMAPYAEKNATHVQAGDAPNRLREANPLLTPEEVARQFRVTSEQVRCLIRRGQLAAVNVGTGPKRPLYRITPEAVAEFLTRRHRAAPAVRLTRKERVSPVPDFFPNLK